MGEGGVGPAPPLPSTTLCPFALPFPLASVVRYCSGPQVLEFPGAKLQTNCRCAPEDYQKPASRCPIYGCQASDPVCSYSQVACVNQYKNSPVCKWEADTCSCASSMYTRKYCLNGALVKAYYEGDTGYETCMQRASPYLTQVETEEDDIGCRDEGGSWWDRQVRRVQGAAEDRE